MLVASLVSATAIALVMLVPARAGAASVRVGGGQLIYSDGADVDGLPEESDVTISLVAGQYLVEEFGAAKFQNGTGCVVVDPSRISCSGVTSISAALGPGDDFFTNDTGLPSSVNAGGGDDTLSGGTAADSFDGGGGDDDLEGDDGADTLLGGDGDEFFMDGGAGNDTLNGGNGADDMDGGPDDDVVHGDAGDDFAFGDDGNDKLYGDGGADGIDGEAGDDTVDGGLGADTLGGGLDTDTVSYVTRTVPVTVDLSVPSGDGENGESDSVGTDIENIVAGSGADTLTGDANANRLEGRAGYDAYSAGGGDDDIQARDSGGDSIACGGGLADSVVADGTQLDAVDADCEQVSRPGGEPPPPPPGEAAARIDIDGPALRYTALTTRDNQLTVLASNGAIDLRDGGVPMQVPGACLAVVGRALCPAAGLTTIVIDVGDGNDLVQLQIPLAAQVHGGSGNDTLVTSGANDLLDGGAGFDVLDGGLGADRMLGGDGSDTVNYVGRFNPVLADLDGRPDDGEYREMDTIGLDVENIDGGSGNDVLKGSTAVNTLVGGGGNDRLYGYSGADLLVGDVGEDKLKGAKGDDILIGGADRDSFSAGPNNDTLMADDGVRDAISCGSGIDASALDALDPRPKSCE
ncbi:MAG: calcium-binding protein [Dehalococcoidia bacterium]